jgi:Holliday junction resolvase RusA-like endonuclease
MASWFATIFGETASKANSRKLVTFGSRPASIKSKKAREWEASALAQLASKKPAKPILGELVLECTIYYATQRPDLDESLVMDVLQKAGVVKNDRQFREKHVFHGIDKEEPRVEVAVYPKAAEAA